MFPTSGAPMPQPQKPETFMLSSEAQQSLPQDAQVALQQVDNLKYFLISAPVDWSPESLIRRFLLPTGEYVSCVLWNNLFHVSGTDIVRCLSFRFQAFGRPVKNPKKFEEGIFSDLRNLKSGTDASLEEPKSLFLDFLYKNNCIRTQKKQKVFYWYSVPHDRLFLDALERDLKREKMGQEATTKAVAEPALSFEFDSSQSLFEQLTKAQQASSSSFATANAGNNHYSQSTSPVLRAVDSMPPPQMIPQQAPRPQEQQPPSMYGHTSMAQPMQNTMTHPMMPREPDYYQQSYDRTQHIRHTSMPTYMEYSPAPSFVSSHGYEDYSNRGMSYEPITPPQHGVHVGAEPAYIANEDTGLYSAIPEMQHMQPYNPMAHLPPSTMAGPTYAATTRPFAPSNVYSVIEGSPTYKARRRRSSIPSSIMNAVAANAVAQVTSGMKTHVPQRPSDLRRSMSSSVLPIAEGDESGTHSPPMAHSYPASIIHHDFSRHTTPLTSLEEDPSAPQSAVSGPDAMHSFGDDMNVHSLQASPAVRLERPGPIRRARSATMMELGMPYKSHSCPIPSCGRLFKRLEHLKRYVLHHLAISFVGARGPFDFALALTNLGG
jgi:transcription factor STE12